MRDILALLVFLGVFAVALVASSPLSALAWIRREWALMRATTWQFIDPDPQLLTLADPRCRRMVIRQRSLGVYLRRDGIYPRVQMSRAWAHDNATFRFARRGA